MPPTLKTVKMEPFHRFQEKAGGSWGGKEPYSCLFCGLDYSMLQPQRLFKKKEKRKRKAKHVALSEVICLNCLIFEVGLGIRGSGCSDWRRCPLLFQKAVIWGSTVISLSSCGMAWEQKWRPHQPLTLPKGSFLLSCLSSGIFLSHNPEL